MPRTLYSPIARKPTCSLPSVLSFIPITRLLSFLPLAIISEATASYGPWPVQQIEEGKGPSKCVCASFRMRETRTLASTLTSSERRVSVHRLGWQENHCHMLQRTTRTPCERCLRQSCCCCMSMTSRRIRQAPNQRFLIIFLTTVERLVSA